MSERFFAAALLLAGLVHLLPLAGILGPQRLQTLYGVEADEPVLALLLQHRALLFGILGGWMVAAAFHAPLRWWAWGAALVSMGGFVLLAAERHGLDARIHRVVSIDLALCLLLGVAAIAQAMTRSR